MELKMTATEERRASELSKLRPERKRYFTKWKLAG
jgi:hypothetical protein